MSMTHFFESVLRKFQTEIKAVFTGKIPLQVLNETMWENVFGP